MGGASWWLTAADVQDLRARRPANPHRPTRLGDVDRVLGLEAATVQLALVAANRPVGTDPDLDRECRGAEGGADLVDRLLESGPPDAGGEREVAAVIDLDAVVVRRGAGDHGRAEVFGVSPCRPRHIHRPPRVEPADARHARRGA